ncbi:LLM class F420-dependent oxidoreductase [Mycobacterium sp. MS1601]|uniref:LLM class F420-dependent oxidoreductase n=1 Tax=Mycobacterium sp. MS1601 TaxID=1936029 RepID=UPI00097945F7|nr:LLM class F420-dependent oxidoreductase [Mycobacterium sp. MS1601]AQA04677.1 LLM class F420-dependent oxidoreductase [Mycobacterium sp. MS1601]
MNLGIHLPIFEIAGGVGAIGGELARVGTAAESSGITWISVMDHYFQIEPMGLPAESNMLEAYTTLGFLAAHTTTVELGALVSGVTYRHPGLLAKIVSTLDVLSSGRAALGLGAAWFEREHHALGVPFPPLAQRFEQLEETLHICAQMWDPDNDGPYVGRHYRLAETLCRPQPIKRPRVLIGGGGERKTLKLVAQYGDACNLFTTSVDDVAHKIEVLGRHCEEVGRDFADIEVTVTAAFPRPEPSGRDEFVSRMAEYAKLGVGTVIVTPTTGRPAAWVDAMAPAVRQLAELG